MSVDDTAIDIQQIFAVANRRKGTIIFVATAGACVALAASFLLKPVFRAEVLLLNSPVEKRSGNLFSGLGGGGAGLAALAGIGEGTDSNSQEALAVLKSRSLIDKFVEDKNLLPVLFKSEWDEKRNAWKIRSPLMAVIAGKQPTLSEAYELFDKKIRHVDEDRRTGLVTLGIEWTDPTLAAQWASEIVNRANAQLRASAIKQSEKSLMFLKDEATKSAEVEVKQAVYKLIDSELKREMFAQVNEDYAFKVIDPPVVPEKKARPKRSLFAALGFLLGAIGALGYLLRAHIKSALS